MDKDLAIKHLKEVSLGIFNVEDYIIELQKAHVEGLKNKKNFIPKHSKTYKPAWKVRGADFYYCVGGETGQIILVKKDIIVDKTQEICQNCLFFDKNKQNAWKIELNKGYLKQDYNRLPCKITEHTDIYAFVTDAYGKELKKNNDSLTENFKKNYPKENIKLELHHINSNSNDNRLSNLIYIPAFIHRRVHVCTLEV